MRRMVLFREVTYSSDILKSFEPSESKIFVWICVLEYFPFSLDQKYEKGKITESSLVLQPTFEFLLKLTTYPIFACLCYGIPTATKFSHPIFEVL